MEPLVELVPSIVVEHVDVELALLREACKCEVAAAEEADDRVVWIGSVAKVELGVKVMPQIQLDDNLLRLDLSAETTQARFVCVRRSPKAALETLGPSVFSA